MAFNINDYKQNVNQYDILRNNRFDVNITTPQILQGTSIVTAGGSTSTGDISRLMTFRAEQFKAPGINLDTKNAYRYGMGPYQKMPFSGRYTDNILTFVSDGYGIIWNFWYQWMNSIFNFAGNDSATGSNIGGFNTLPSYQIEYKDKYATMVSVKVYNVRKQEVQTINMYDAYPVSLNDVQLNWGTKNEALRITVGLTFKEFTMERSTVSGSYNPSNAFNEMNQKIGRLNMIDTQNLNTADGRLQSSVAAGAAVNPIANPTS